jgi:hypothetical protein
MVQGDICSTAGIMDVLEKSLGLSPQIVAQALLPALCHKALLLAGMAPKEADKCKTKMGTLDIPNWNQSRIDEAKSAITACLDGDITEEDFANLLRVSGATEHAGVMFELFALQNRLAVVLPKKMVQRILMKVKADTDEGEDFKTLGTTVRACIGEGTKHTQIFELLRLVDEPFGKAAARIMVPLVLKTLMFAGLRAESEIVRGAVAKTRGLVRKAKGPLGAEAGLESLLARCELPASKEQVPDLLTLLGIPHTMAGDESGVLKNRQAAMSEVSRTFSMLSPMHTADKADTRVGSSAKAVSRQTEHGALGVLATPSLVQQV